VDQASVRSVLVIHPGTLGDVLLSLPALAAVRRRHPGHQLVLLARSDIGCLLHVCGVIDRTLTTDSGDLASLMGGTELRPPLQELLHSCDDVIGWLRDPDGILDATLRSCGVRHVTLVPPTPIEGVHQSQRFLQIVEEKDHYGVTPRVVVPESVKELGATALRAVHLSGGDRVVVCHPGSGSRHKCISAHTMAAAMRNLQQSGFNPLIVGGPADQEAVERVRELSHQAVPVIQGQSLTTMAGILAAGRLFLGQDSGVTHLAAALHIPTAAIFGPTDPRQWAPVGEHVAILTGPVCFCSTWERVRSCAEKPCLSISVDVITEACRSLLRRYRSVTKS
jgi:heptosyltransferase III